MRRRAAIGLTVGGTLAAMPGCGRRDDGEKRGGAAGPDTAAAGGGGAEGGTSAEGKPAGSGPGTGTDAAAGSGREGRGLMPVRVEEGLEIRTIAGLRPYRPSGFVVRREDVSGRVLVHNYGHGGGGFSLSWGSAALAADLAGDVAGKDCAVVGGGVMGLSTGRLLQQRGARVTILTRDLPPDTTSNVAGAQWWPFSVFDNSRRTPAFAEQYVRAAEFSWRYFQGFTGPEWGVGWLPNYYLSDGPPENGWLGGPGGVLHGMQIDFRDFAPGEHVFSTGHVRRFSSMMIEPPVYLRRLMEEFRLAGGQVTVRAFADAAEVLALPQPVIFNCAGLGAGALFGDREILPIKGQLTFLMPQPEVRYNLICGNCYMFPRTDGILLGGTYEHGQWNVTPDAEAKRKILAEQRTIFRKMRELQTG